MASRGRGHWDRMLSCDDRRVAQRLRILAATARANAEHGRALTLSDIVLEAGVGRNTFYEHFEDVDAAIRAAVAESIEGTARAIEQAVADARTPIERLRSMARAWVASALERPGLVDAIRQDPTRQSGRTSGRTGLERALGDVLADAKAAGVIGQGPEPVRLFCVVGAFEAAAVLIGETTPPIHRERMEDLLVDLTLRAFR
jgi:AcrR family transcriptional regulator